MENVIQGNKEDFKDSLAAKSLSFFNVACEMLSDLPERSQEITKKRFGLGLEKPETLEKIGGDYGITRERVRQIVADTLKKVSSRVNSMAFKKAEDRIIFTIESSSGIIKELELIKKLSAGDHKEANSLVFLRECSERIQVSEKGNERVWFTSREKFAAAMEVGLAVQEILKKEKKLLSDGEIVQRAISAKPGFLPEEILNYISIFPVIKKNSFGKWGMADWVEISPKGTRERIYAVLKEKGKPLHFTEIAKLIDEYGLSKKKAHVQTVHNELIKNDHFVLIGRGIYALKEWGYFKGTIREVLEDIFKKNKRFLSKEEILSEVSKVRKVKKATVLINLSNDKLFIRQNNLYSLKRG